MNLWALRSKANQAKAEAPKAASKPPSRPITIPPPPPQPVKPVVAEPLPEKIGLNDLFDFTDAQVRQISPTGNFTKLRNPMRKATSQHQVLAASAVAAVAKVSTSIKVGLDALLTMDAEQVDKLMDKR